jgi:hypothetical protein
MEVTTPLTLLWSKSWNYGNHATYITVVNLGIIAITPTPLLWSKSWIKGNHTSSSTVK